MSTQNFTDFVNNERERLNVERNKLDEQIAELVGQRGNVDRELAAIFAYEAARAGKTPTSNRGKNNSQSGGASTRQARRGSKRESLISLIQQHPQGLSRGDILDKMGLKGDKAGEMSVSNALTALIKSNVVARNSGKYMPIAA